MRRVLKLSLLFPILVLLASLSAAAQTKCPPTGPNVDPPPQPNGQPPDFAAVFLWDHAQITGVAALEISVATPLTSGQRRFELFLEAPFTVTGRADVRSADSQTSGHFRAMFFTPGLQLKMAATRAVLPWISAGGGLAHFSPSALSQGGGISSARSSTVGALQLGVGVDFKITNSRLVFRAQIRDYYAGAPNLGSLQTRPRNNLMIGGGVVFRFR